MANPTKAYLNGGQRGYLVKRQYRNEVWYLTDWIETLQRTIRCDYRSLAQGLITIEDYRRNRRLDLYAISKAKQELNYAVARLAHYSRKVQAYERIH